MEGGGSWETGAVNRLCQRRPGGAPLLGRRFLQFQIHVAQPRCHLAEDHAGRQRGDALAALALSPVLKIDVPALDSRGSCRWRHGAKTRRNSTGHGARIGADLAIIHPMDKGLETVSWTALI